MARIDVDEAGTNLSRLIDRAREGEEIIIESWGRAVAKIMAYDEKGRGLLALKGIWKNKATIADDFDELPEDLQRAFGMIDDCNDPL